MPSCTAQRVVIATLLCPVPLLFTLREIAHGVYTTKGNNQKIMVQKNPHILLIPFTFIKLSPSINTCNTHRKHIHGKACTTCICHVLAMSSGQQISTMRKRCTPCGVTFSSFPSKTTHQVHQAQQEQTVARKRHPNHASRKRNFSHNIHVQRNLNVLHVTPALHHKLRQSQSQMRGCIA